MARTLKPLLLAAGLLLALGAAGAPPRFKWPLVEILEEIRVTDIIQAEGTPVALRALRVRGELKPLLQYYVTSFERAGLYLMPGKEQPQFTAGPMLTALDTRRGITYTVFFEGRPDGTTLVMLSEANFALQSKTRPGDFAPLMPSADHVLRSSDEGAQVLSFQVKAREAAVRAFYAEALARERWVLGKDETDQEEVFRRGEQTLQVFTEAHGDGTSSVVLLLRGR